MTKKRFACNLFKCEIYFYAKSLALSSTSSKEFSQKIQSEE